MTSKVTIKLYGREYSVACGKGEETRLQDIVNYVEQKMQQVADNSGNTSESRLFMLTCLLLADELMEIKNNAESTRKADEELMVAAVNHLRDRVAHIASQVGNA